MGNYKIIGLKTNQFKKRYFKVLFGQSGLRMRGCSRKWCSNNGPHKALKSECLFGIFPHFMGYYSLNKPVSVKTKLQKVDLGDEVYTQKVRENSKNTLILILF